MSRKLRAPKFPVWESEDSTTALYSVETGVKQLDTVLYELEIDAAVNGTIEVEGSTDRDEVAVKEWSALDFGTVISLVGSSSLKDQILIRDNTFTFLRLKFTNNGGTGNINASISGVSVGA